MSETICPDCGELICQHGLCWCADRGDGACRECSDRRQREYEADREAKFQREVIGPMFGFDDDEEGAA